MKCDNLHGIAFVEFLSSCFLFFNHKKEWQIQHIDKVV